MDILSYISFLYQTGNKTDCVKTAKEKTLVKTLNDMRLAVLIDADNVPYSNVKGMMEELTLYGTPTFKRIYGDWTKPTVSGWKSVLLENAITPVQQYSYTTGKNATDSAMIIDAMDILYSGKVDGFCIVSSDSDFTRLATRLREAGMKVIGIGEKKTPSPFIVACDKFIYIEVINSSTIKPETPTSEASKNKKTMAKPKVEPKDEINTPEKTGPKLVNTIASSITYLADENGWAFLGDVGNLILKKQPDFDPRNYGYTKLTSLIKAIDKFEIDIRETGQLKIKHIYIRIKK
jgi:uncharacterized LabA/DUF88 family protein